MGASIRWMLAALWLTVAAVFLWPGREAAGPLPGYMALLLAAYNGFRALTVGRPRAAKWTSKRRPRRLPTDAEPDPNFQFDPPGDHV